MLVWPEDSSGGGYLLLEGNSPPGLGLKSEAKDWSKAPRLDGSKTQEAHGSARFLSVPTFDGSGSNGSISGQPDENRENQNILKSIPKQQN